MVSDRELLELAAKAAGIEGRYSETIGEDWGRYSGQPGIATNGRCWNPLDDDGNAFQLAITLGMAVSICLNMPNGDFTIVLGTGIKEVHAGSPGVATRRAIVRAAAEIGKDM